MRARRVRAPLEASRGWLLALSSTALAITAHGAAGGGLPDTALILPLTALMVWGGAALAHRVRGVLALTVLLGAIQFVLHLLLTENANGHAEHLAAPPVDSSTMLAGHALATLITAALLSRASIALGAAALAWLRARLSPVLPVAVPATIGIAIAAPARPGLLLEVLFRHVNARRGPPVRS